MLSETIAELERLEKAATKGPWFTDKPPLDADGWSTGQVVAAVAPRQCVYASPPGGTFPESDRQFIAAFRTHARELLAAAKLSEARARACELAKALIANTQGMSEGECGFWEHIEPLKTALAAAEKGGAEGGSK